MANLTVTVPLLNKRSLPVDDTSDKGNVTGKVKAGFQFESVEQLKNTAGDWFRDKDGSWYWGGGLSGQMTSFGGQSKLDLKLIPVNYDEDKMGWAFKRSLNGIDILSIWNDHNLYGQSVNVAVLDSGINTSISDITDAIRNRILDTKSFVPNESIEDDIGHGTSCASIIAARGNKLFGVSPQCNLIIGKIESKNFGKTPKVILEALKWACEDRNADIISLSFSFPSISEIPSTPEDKAISEYILKMQTEKNKFFVCAIGNLGENAKAVFAYPANYDGSVSIGAIGNDRILWKGSSWNKKLSFVVPGVNLKGYDLSGKKTVLEPATSFACPFAAGILANLICHYKINNIPFLAKNVINNLVYDAPLENEPLKYGKGIVNIIESLKKIKS